MTSDMPVRWMPGWQRVLMALAFLLLSGQVRAMGGVPGALLAIACGAIVLAALGFVELAMALWYRSRRALRRTR